MASSKKALQALHEALAVTLADAITTGVPIQDKETGEVTIAPAPAAVLSVARQFLKDNNIEAVDVPGSALHSLAHGLPFMGQDEVDERNDTALN